GKAERAVPIFIKTSGRGHEVVGGGQSFGGRVASMAAVEADFGGLVLFSYPLHRPGHPDELRTEHLPSIRCPTLFLSGDRDPFARIDLLKEAVKLVPNAHLEIFKGQGSSPCSTRHSTSRRNSSSPTASDRLTAHGPGEWPAFSRHGRRAGGRRDVRPPARVP